MGDLADFGAVVLGILAHDCAVARSDSYFVVWSRVSAAGGDGSEVEAGWMKGVLAGLDEPSTVVLSTWEGRELYGGIV